MLSGRLRLEFLSQPRSVLFTHVFKRIESQACEKVLGFFGYTLNTEMPSDSEKENSQLVKVWNLTAYRPQVEVTPDTEKELYLLKLYFDGEGFIRDVESLTEDQAREIRLEIIRAMPDPEPPPRRGSIYREMGVETRK